MEIMSASIFEVFILIFYSFFFNLFRNFADVFINSSRFAIFWEGKSYHLRFQKSRQKSIIRKWVLISHPAFCMVMEWEKKTNFKFQA